MPTINNPTIYELAKEEADKKYSKPSAFKSGYIVKKYKELGGTYREDGEPRNLERWFQEKWTDVGNSDYPVFRPTKRISKATPLTVSEIDKGQLQKQIKLKQRIKGTSNLPPFKGI
jgi:hypothetical protein